MTSSPSLLLSTSADRAAVHSLTLLLFRSGIILGTVLEQENASDEDLQDGLRGARICLLCQGPSREKIWNTWPQLSSLLGFQGFSRSDEEWRQLVVLLPGAEAIHTLPLFLRKATVVDFRSGFTPEAVGKLIQLLPTQSPWWSHQDPQHSPQDEPPAAANLDGEGVVERSTFQKDAREEDLDDGKASGSSWHWPPPTPQRPLKILVFAAEPDDTHRVRLDRVYRSLEKSLRSTPAMVTRRVELKHSPAVQRQDLQSTLRHFEPDVIHFMGHGGRWETLNLDSDSGDSDRLEPEAFLSLIDLYRSQLRMVYLDACFTKYLGEKVISMVPCAIGMRKAVSNEAATRYCQEFYAGLGYGHSIARAHREGLTGLSVYRIPEGDIPQLLLQDGVDGDDYVLLPEE
ncbi:MAG: CHAT domain-containing protein [Acidobacteriota bacterium]